MAAQFFDPNGALNAALPVNAPRAANEASYVQDFLAQWNQTANGVRGSWTGIGAPWVNTGKQFSIPVFVVPHSTPRVVVEYVDPWTATPGFPENTAYAAVQNGNKDNELAWRLAQGVPLPSALLNDAFYNYGVGVTGKGDAGVAIIDDTTGELWEFWVFCTGRSTGKPCCAYGGWMPDHRQNPGYFIDAYPPYQSSQWGSSATSISITGAQISQQELIDGVVPHAIGLDLMGAENYPSYVWPAQRTDGQGWSPIPEGTRFRLDPTVNINTINVENDATATRTIKAWAKAMQDYGWIVWDKGGSCAVQVEPTSYNFYGAASSYTAMLRSIPLNASTVQVVDPSWRPGQAINNAPGVARGRNAGRGGLKRRAGRL